MVCMLDENHTQIIHFLAELHLYFDPKWVHPDMMTPAGDINVYRDSESEGKHFVLQDVKKSNDDDGASGGVAFHHLSSALQKTIETGLVGVANGEGWEVGSGEGEGEWREVCANTWSALICVESMK